MFRFLQPSSGWSSLAPIACAVHCAAAPFLVALSPALAESTQLEWGFLGATLLFGLVGLPERTHALRDPRPTLLLGAGIVLWTLSLLHLLEPVPEPVTTTVAALMAAGGLFWNARLHAHAGD